MQVIPIKSRLINPGDDLLEALDEGLNKINENLKEKDILVVSSKVFSFAENRLENEENKVLNI